MQARAERVEESRTAHHGKVQTVKDFLRALRRRPRLASPKMPPRRSRYRLPPRRDPTDGGAR